MGGRKVPESGTHKSLKAFLVAEQKLTKEVQKAMEGIVWQSVAIVNMGSAQEAPALERQIVRQIGFLAQCEDWIRIFLGPPHKMLKYYLSHWKHAGMLWSEQASIMLFCVAVVLGALLNSGNNR